MFKPLYDAFLSALAGSWSAFTSQYGEKGTEFENAFKTKFYPVAGIYLVALTVVFCICYYYYFNARYGNYYTIGKYAITSLITALLLALLTYVTGKSMFKTYTCPTTAHITYLSFINFLYSLILFFIVAILIKKKSPMGNRTPF